MVFSLHLLRFTKVIGELQLLRKRRKTYLVMVLMTEIHLAVPIPLAITRKVLICWEECLQNTMLIHQEHRFMIIKKQVENITMDQR